MAKFDMLFCFCKSAVVQMGNESTSWLPGETGRGSSEWTSSGKGCERERKEIKMNLERGEVSRTILK